MASLRRVALSSDDSIDLSPISGFKHMDFGGDGKVRSGGNPSPNSIVILHSPSASMDLLQPPAHSGSQAGALSGVQVLHVSRPGNTVTLC
ncbi:hypothetical protein AURDEDRAFT_175880 [Auricularia subglabra TFB-10046 SS5]|uniref:Uncharacterized protein n=1 Tax=Auricularia subglabra (strain TFB-10046 / SS5) TaxID=717982 RepID=J0WQY6_AURST|nr:hypothetical protein AURDEDRAFT_175880 [Auricularia subglabra TFB-10046 SS5]